MEMGIQAAEMLIEMIEHKSDGGGLDREAHIFQPELIIRESTRII
jgi:DNA-binding LacI/PurR family transcriptional regulator